MLNKRLNFKQFFSPKIWPVIDIFYVLQQLKFNLQKLQDVLRIKILHQTTTTVTENINF